MKTGIYCITNIINGKKYVGQSINITRRWRRHLTTANKKKFPLYLSMNKHGAENFVMDVLEECEIDILNDREQYWIEATGCISPHGYNLTSGGNAKKIYSPEIGRKISAAMTGSKNPMFGRDFSAIHRARLSASLKIKTVSQATRDLKSKLMAGDKNHMWGKVTTAETKRKIIEANSGDKNHFYGKNHTEESKIKSGRARMKGRVIKCSNGNTYLSNYEASCHTQSNNHGVCEVLHGRKKTTNSLVFWYA